MINIFNVIYFHFIIRKGDCYMYWQEEMRNNITDIAQLAATLRFTDEEKEKLDRLLEHYPMSIPRYYLSLVDPDDPNDPIRKMCVPTVTEFDSEGDFDTSGEAHNTVVSGVQHKYDESALVLTTNRCAMYCRHCFRKRLIGLTDEEILARFDEMIRYVREHEEITNVILSGGDALMLPTATLERYLGELTQIPHIDLIRLASRMPVVYPMRIFEDAKLLALLRRYTQKKQLYIVTQFNHPNELTPQARTAVQALLRCGVVVKNQTVLLRGVNDTPETLGSLLRGLTSIGVVPYYVFQCRPVTGVKTGFQVPFLEGYDIVERAKAMQSGQGKCFKYCLSHPTGKIEIVGKLDDTHMVFKYHQFKSGENAGRIFIRELSPDDAWLGEIEAIDN